MKLETIKVGRIVNAHGIRGEVRVQPRDGDPGFLTRFRTFYMDGRPITPGVEDMNAALSLKGKELYIRREDAQLPPGQWFDDELLGLPVFDETGERLGELTAVENYPAHKVYTVRGEREYLIPAVEGAFILSIDMDAGRMTVRVWEGM